ncbi:fungal-specific transcription factor domain-containing protein [Talaromyces proteolyticus]|uniref:Fungal-specific transcription factor domain-containing protein n=1 Tax=Talaromyces proteolyticus TaxID=1131652 RepID=A0AAD4L3G7_9EURO|nr:fungal-specific transcription factor domain-containing protein [Talaromyces proteolyticus]KAH8705218.1 fungal-specific transcription factor domain-containing protein [Talaromyces proteolyticus]
MNPERCKAKVSAPLACTGCRKQHLKCDANRPACSRCVKTGLACHYLPSRRGGRRKSCLTRITPEQGSGMNDGPRSIGESHRSYGLQTDNTPNRLDFNGPLPTIPQDDIQLVPRSENVDHRRASDVMSVWPGMVSDNSMDLLQSSDPPDEPTPDDRSIRLFYENFHTAHPILVPSSLYNARNYPLFLQLVVNFIGSHYLPASPDFDYKERVAAELSSSADRSPYMVQALLMFAIALYARGEGADALTVLNRSIGLALDLGMHRQEYASSCYPNQSIDAESLRRTWWELYITDVLMAAPRKKLNFQCASVPHNVALPCEEAIYANGDSIPEPPTIRDFQQRVFADEEATFSSFSYRIDATKILSRILVLNRLRDCHRDHLQAVENALVSWVNHIPAKKADIMDSYGNVDEMLFQAHLTIAYAAMLLHLPRSDLHPAPPSTESLFYPWVPHHLPPSFPRLVHSIKATEASKQLSDFISICPIIHRHTPFTVSALVLCGMVQLATCANHSNECLDHHRNRVILVLGCLKNLKRTWAVAEPAYHHVRSSALQVDKLTTEPSNPSLAAGETLPNEDGNPHMGMTSVNEQRPISQRLTPTFIDPTCSNTFFFNSISDFDFT